MTLLGIISVALGFTNLLPIPALDGGRILLLLPELIFRKRIPVQYENMINLAGFVLLILLMVFVTAQDILNPIQIHNRGRISLSPEKHIPFSKVPALLDPDNPFLPVT